MNGSPGKQTLESLLVCCPLALLLLWPLEVRLLTAVDASWLLSQLIKGGSQLSVCETWLSVMPLVCTMIVGFLLVCSLTDLDAIAHICPLSRVEVKVVKLDELAIESRRAYIYSYTPSPIPTLYALASRNSTSIHNAFIPASEH